MSSTRRFDKTTLSVIKPFTAFVVSFTVATVPVENLPGTILETLSLPN